MVTVRSMICGYFRLRQHLRTVPAYPRVRFEASLPWQRETRTQVVAQAAVRQAASRAQLLSRAVLGSNSVFSFSLEVFNHPQHRWNVYG